MALTISGTRIFLTRGDTLKIRLTLQRVVDGSQTEYEPQEGDQIRFALKHKTMNNARTEFVDTEPILTKIIPVSDMILQLDPEDTAGIGFGKLESRTSRCTSWL